MPSELQVVIPYREVFDKVSGVVTQLAIEDQLAASFQKQQLVKSLKDVNAGLVDGAHNGPASVHNVAHGPHDDGSCSCIKTCALATVDMC